MSAALCLVSFKPRHHALFIRRLGVLYEKTDITRRRDAKNKREGQNKLLPRNSTQLMKFHNMALDEFERIVTNIVRTIDAYGNGRKLRFSRATASTRSIRSINVCPACRSLSRASSPPLTANLVPSPNALPKGAPFEHWYALQRVRDRMHDQQKSTRQRPHFT